MNNHLLHTSFQNSPDLTMLKNIIANAPNFDNSENFKLNNTEEPIILFVDYLIKHACQLSASDIHIESLEKNSRIRYRHNGIMHEIIEIPHDLALRLIARLKIMAKLDLAERRLPQDGRIQLPSIDIRINFCPTLFGEKTVLRILNPKKISLNIHELGFTEQQKQIFINKISKPQGLILVTGPTGCGKTVTLYSALNLLNTSERNISTVEDPIEIHLKGINQVNINPKINLNFATILRTLLRQDPDIIMIGEIRDLETAKIAIQAAQTGHLVFSTLHTNSALETIDRLKIMGINPAMFLNSLSLIIGQRLIRKLCDYCKFAETVSLKRLQSFGFYEETNDLQTFNATGCSKCTQGFNGRTGLYEFLIPSEQLKILIRKNVELHEITKIAQSEGFQTLKNIGFNKLKKGITSLIELNRVTI